MEYVDALTGEIVERDDPNQVAEKKLYEVGAVTEETFDIIRNYKDIKEQYEMVQYALKKGMKENDIKKWANDLFTCSFTPEGTKTTFDTERAKATKLIDFLKILNTTDDKILRDYSVYDYFQKISYVKDKVTIRIKDDK